MTHDHDQILVESCRADEITALDLSQHVKHAETEGEPVETYRLVRLNDDGYRDIFVGQMVWYPDVGRAGIMWGGDSDWTDASSPEDAVRRWQEGEMLS